MNTRLNTRAALAVSVLALTAASAPAMAQDHGGKGDHANAAQRQQNREARQDARQQARQEARANPAAAPRREARQEARQEQRQQARQEQRQQVRQEQRQEVRQAARQQERRQENRQQEARQQARQEARQDARQDARRDQARQQAAVQQQQREARRDIRQDRAEAARDIRQDQRRAQQDIRQDRREARREIRQEQRQAVRDLREIRSDRVFVRNDPRFVILRDRDRDYRRAIVGCPPGLAKRDNGCVPPGLERRTVRYDYPRYDWVWRASDRRDRYDWRYDDGYVYRYSPQGSVLGYLPVLGGALWTGQTWPTQYAYEPAPTYYTTYYDLPNRYDYRYADGVIYGVDRQNSGIQQIAALLTGQNWNIGQTMPVGYDVYNVPYAYRGQYIDQPDRWYRYNDGYVYQVDPTTRLVQAAVQLLA